MSPVTDRTSEWRTVTIGELGKVITGATPSSKQPAFFGETYPFVTPSDIDGSSRSVEAGRFISEEGHDVLASRILPPGAVCLVCIGSIGKICMTNRPSFTNQQINSIIVDSDKYDSEFVYYLLSTLSDHLRGIASGAATPIVNKSVFSNIQVRVPPLPTQRNIGLILSAYDDLVENNLRRIQILEKMAQAIYREWFVKFRLPGIQDAMVVDSSLGKIPEGWKIEAFADIAEFVNGYAFKPSDWQNSGRPIIKIKELKEGITSSTPRYSGDDLHSKYLIRSGDVLFSWSADLDVYLWAFGEGWLNQHLFVVRPLRGISRPFIFHALKHRMPEFRARSLGTTMSHIKRRALHEVKALVPPSDSRKLFDENVEVMLQQVRNLHSENALLRRTRDLLLPRLIFGELDVSSLEIESEVLHT